MNQDSSVAVAPGTCVLTVMPAINAVASAASLARVDTVEVGAADTLIARVWHYAEVTVRLVDQNGAPDDSADFLVPYGFASRRVGHGIPVWLPVTEDASAPPAIGEHASGYTVAVRPSINGYRQNGSLSRNEPAVELTESGLIRTFVWKFADITPRLVDQNGAPDDLSGRG